MEDRDSVASEINGQELDYTVRIAASSLGLRWVELVVDPACANDLVMMVLEYPGHFGAARLPLIMLEAPTFGGYRASPPRDSRTTTASSPVLPGWTARSKMPRNRRCTKTRKTGLTAGRPPGRRGSVTCE